MRHTFKDWLYATRFWALPVSIMPVVATFCYCSCLGIVSGPEAAVNFAIAIAGVALLHSAGNVLSDYFDYKSGVDNAEAFAVPNLVYGTFKPREYLIFSIMLFAAGAAAGFVLVARCGLGLLWAGGAGVALTALYSFFKYHALGDLDVFIIFSILIMLGSSYVICGTYHPEVLVLALPVGIITVSVLHANNTVDIVSDRKAGIRTFAMTIGAKHSSILYCIYMAIPFLWIAICAAAGWVHPASLICFLAAPKAYKNLRQASTFPSVGVEAMSGLDMASSKLQLVYSLSLSAGLLLSLLL